MNILFINIFKLFLWVEDTVLITLDLTHCDQLMQTILQPSLLPLFASQPLKYVCYVKLFHRKKLINIIKEDVFHSYVFYVSLEIFLPDHSESVVEVIIRKKNTIGSDFKNQSIYSFQYKNSCDFHVFTFKLIPWKCDYFWASFSIKIVQVIIFTIIRNLWRNIQVFKIAEDVVLTNGDFVLLCYFQLMVKSFHPLTCPRKR